MKCDVEGMNILLFVRCWNLNYSTYGLETEIFLGDYKVKKN